MIQRERLGFIFGETTTDGFDNGERVGDKRVVDMEYLFSLTSVKVGKKCRQRCQAERPKETPVPKRNGDLLGIVSGCHAAETCLPDRRTTLHPNRSRDFATH